MHQQDLDERRKWSANADAAAVNDKRGNFISNHPKMVNLQVRFRPVQVVLKK